jgi:hypothetical protein
MLLRMRALPQAFWPRLALGISLLAFAAASSSAFEECWSPRHLEEIRAIEDRVRIGNGFFIVRTDHFTVRSEIDARFTAELARYMELFESSATELLMLPDVASPSAAEVTVFASQGNYQRSLGKATRSRGQFDWRYPDEHASCVYTIRTFAANARERRFSGFCRSIINHEAAHYLLQLRAGRHRIPNLVHEGVATYLQAWDFFKSAEWNRAHHACEFAPNLKSAVAARTVPSMSWLSDVAIWDIDDFGPMTNERYACAENFVAFLLGEDERKPFFKRLLGAATGGENLHRLFTSGPGADLEADWRRVLFDGADQTGVAGHGTPVNHG